MVVKILEKLKTKYNSLGLEETILKGTAETLAKSVEAEDQIDAAVEGVEGQMRIYQSFADQNRTLTKEIQTLKKSKTDDPDPDPNPNPAIDPKPDPKKDDVPEWAKTIVENQKKILEKQQLVDQEALQKANSEKLVSKLKSLNVKESFYKPMIEGRSFENDEAIEAFAASVHQSEQTYLKENNLQTLENRTEPIFGIVAKEGDVSPAVQNFINQKYKTNETS